MKFTSYQKKKKYCQYEGIFYDDNHCLFVCVFFGHTFYKYTTITVSSHSILKMFNIINTYTQSNIMNYLKIIELKIIRISYYNSSNKEYLIISIGIIELI